ncbi:MAG: amidohydrolase, partial [Negativicutes bacterium]|nr:amidohydrolase [Negativicutes bacterium]
LCAGTGVVADIGPTTGRTVAIRADIDALPLSDEIDQPYCSQNEGVCHACGHDAHTAGLLGLAGAFAAHQDQLPGRIRLLFQPSEEWFDGGAKEMIEEGCLEGVDFAIGMHVWQPVEAGKIAVNHVMMGSPNSFELTIQGVGGHGSMPHQCVDPILVGSQIVQAFNTIISRSIDPLEVGVLSIGSFHSGAAFNVIPDKSVVTGNLRTLNAETRDRIFDRMEEICRGTCQAMGATYQLNRIYGYPALVNDPKVMDLAVNVITETYGADARLVNKPTLGGEDFSYFLEKVPGVFLFVGAGNVEKGITYPHHHPKFDIDESALGQGAEVLGLIALRLLEKGI